VEQSKIRKRQTERHQAAEITARNAWRRARRHPAAAAGCGGVAGIGSWHGKRDNQPAIRSI